MSRVQDKLQAKSDLHEKVARIIWMEMSPTAIGIDWEDALPDDRRAALQAAEWVLSTIRTHDLDKDLGLPS